MVIGETRMPATAATVPESAYDSITVRGGGDAHQLAGVAVGGDRLERLAEQRLALEQLDQTHDREDADGDRDLERRDVDAEDVDRVGRNRRREGAVVAAPDVLGRREEEQAEDDGEQDPAFALLLEREAHGGALDEEPQERAEEQAAGTMIQ